MTSVRQTTFLDIQRLRAVTEAYLALLEPEVDTERPASRELLAALRTYVAALPPNVLIALLDRLQAAELALKTKETR